MRIVPVVVLGGLLAGQAALAGPHACGDDVAGRVVPCACGDTLVSSRTLDDRDPVTHETCDGTGLTVKIAARQHGATLALGGRALRGTGEGAGLEIVAGGADGLTIAGPGAIEGFDIGVLAPTGTVHAVRDVVAVDNASDGFVIGGSGFAVTGCEAARNGQDGFALRGTGFQLDGNRATANRRHGFSIAGRDAAIGTLDGNTASGNGRTGMRIRGRRHGITRPVTDDNGGAGLVARVTNGAIAGGAAHRNGQHGVQAMGSGLAVSDTDATDNGSRQIDVRGSGRR